MTALVVLRDQVIGPILAGVLVPDAAASRPPWTAVDSDYESLRLNMQTLFRDLRIATEAIAA